MFSKRFYLVPDNRDTYQAIKKKKAADEAEALRSFEAELKEISQARQAFFVWRGEDYKHAQVERESQEGEIRKEIKAQLEELFSELEETRNKLEREPLESSPEGGDDGMGLQADLVEYKEILLKVLFDFVPIYPSYAHFRYLKILHFILEETDGIIFYRMDKEHGEYKLDQEIQALEMYRWSMNQAYQSAADSKMNPKLTDWSMRYIAPLPLYVAASYGVAFGGIFPPSALPILIGIALFVLLECIGSLLIARMMPKYYLITSAEEQGKKVLLKLHQLSQGLFYAKQGPVVSGEDDKPYTPPAPG